MSTDDRFAFSEDRLAKVLQALKRNDFLAYFFPKSSEALAMVLKGVHQGMRVGLGGSHTLRQMGFPEALKEKGAALLDHWDESMEPGEILATRKAQLLCDLFNRRIEVYASQTLADYVDSVSQLLEGGCGTFLNDLSRWFFAVGHWLPLDKRAARSGVP